MPAFTNKYINEKEWNKKNNELTELHLIPLEDIHLYSNYNQEAEVNGNGSAIAFLIPDCHFYYCVLHGSIISILLQQDPLKEPEK